MTYYDIEPNNIDSENLAYLFQGITDDGKYSVMTWFPVAALILPKDTYHPYDKDKVKVDTNDYEAYCLRMQRNFEALPPDAYKPNLLLLEKLIRSIRVEKVADK